MWQWRRCGAATAGGTCAGGPRCATDAALRLQSRRGMICPKPRAAFLPRRSCACVMEACPQHRCCRACASKNWWSTSSGSEWCHQRQLQSGISTCEIATGASGQHGWALQDLEMRMVLKWATWMRPEQERMSFHPCMAIWDLENAILLCHARSLQYCNAKRISFFIRVLFSTVYLRITTL
jgi:hypothetical protein